jgi:predicted enzyme related to lactoylglutathione lyase
MIKGVKHVSIPVKDQDRALKFWTKKVGFQVVCDVPFDGGQRWIELKIPDADTQVVLFTPEGHEGMVGTFSNVVFHTSDVKKAFEQLTSRGVEFTVPPSEEPWGIYAIFKDEEGNSFCLSSS